MSSFRTLGRIGLILLALSGAASLSACSSFRPVYGYSGIVSSSIALSYAKPNSRLEQIIYQEMALRFGKTQSEDAPRLTVSAGAGARALTRTSIAKPATQYDVTVTGSATLTTADGKVVFSGSRKATAAYTTVGQVLADTEAANEAQERAAKELSELLRLAILSALANPLPEPDSLPGQ